MDSKFFEEWLLTELPRYDRLTRGVISIVSSLLSENEISFLSVDGRAKSYESCLEKAARKNYRDPKVEMMDFAGIRVICYFEHDVERAREVIVAAFQVDIENSSNRDDLMSANEVGYRSVHLVCDLGQNRTSLPEFRSFDQLKFEIQVRTVLQHAWAELAHDRNYKFQGKLPRQMERSLYLLAGLFETADRGFSELSQEIDSYISDVSEKTAKGDLRIDINSLSLTEFVSEWTKSNSVYLSDSSNNSGKIFPEVINELNDFGIYNLQELQKIIKPEVAKVLTGKSAQFTLFGIVRLWMITYNPKKFVKDVKFHWILSQSHGRTAPKSVEQRGLRDYLESIWFGF